MSAATQEHVVVTGGCGFFGAWIIKQLLESGKRVSCFDISLMTKRWEMVMTPAQIETIAFVKCDLAEPSFIDQLVEARPDAVIHLAGLQVPTCREKPVLGAKVNVIGSLNVFEAAKALQAAGATVPRIVYASSAAIFGPDAEYGETAVGDLSIPKPSSHYGAYKLCVEYCAKAYWTTNGIASVGLRPLTVYGPGRDVGVTSFPTRAIAAAIKGEAFTVPFTGATSYIHVREIADMFVKIAAAAVADAKVYTVGGDTIDTKGFIEIVDGLVPGAARLVTATGGDIPFPSKLDDAALRADYPAVIRIPIKDGIAETVEVYRRMHAAGTLTV